MAHRKDDPQLLLPFEYVKYTPEECGWVRLPGGQYVTYEKCDGELYIFAPGQPLEIVRFKERG